MRHITIKSKRSLGYAQSLLFKALCVTSDFLQSEMFYKRLKILI